MEQKTTFYPDLSEVRKQTTFVVKENTKTSLMEKTLSALLQIPPDYISAEDYIRIKLLSKQEISELAWDYLQECLYEDDDDPELLDYPVGKGTIYWKEPQINQNWHSGYLPDVIKLLLKYGLDPNYSIAGKNTLAGKVTYIVNGYVAADTLKLLFEHGGDPMLLFDGELLYDEIAFDAWFDAIEMDNRRRYDSLMHCWFVLLAFGGKPYTGVDPVDVFHNASSDGFADFDLRLLKDHRNYFFGITHENGRTIHIFDKHTFWEVARL